MKQLIVPIAIIVALITCFVVKFGEITFYDESGHMTFAPDSFDEKIGETFVLPNKL